MKCSSCKEHEVLGKWTGEGGALADFHGDYEYWCECCIVRAQLDYAHKQAERIPTLEARLATACSSGRESHDF